VAFGSGDSSSTVLTAANRLPIFAAISFSNRLNRASMSSSSSLVAVVVRSAAVDGHQTPAAERP
jgi:hypothetical protein